jgi:hypothetical protein
MNHRFEPISNFKSWKTQTPWDLVINTNKGAIIHVVYYNIEFDYYYIYMNPNQPRMLKTQEEIIKYLILNNICTIVDKHSQKLILTPNALLELI